MSEPNKLLRQLIESGETYASLFFYHPDCIYIMDLDGRYVDCNPGQEKLTGFTREQFLASRPEKYSEQLEQRHAAFAKAAEGSAAEFEAVIRRKDGVLIDIHVTYVPIVKDGHVVGIYGIAKDVSAEKQAIAKLNESEHLLHTISEHAQDLITYSSADGVISYVSPSIIKLLGYEPKELIRKGIRLRDLLVNPMEDGVPTETAADEIQFTARVRHRDGGVRWFETTVKMIRDEQGSIEMLLGISRDVTTRKLALDQLRKSEQNLALAQQLAQIGSWSYSFDHDEWECSDEARRIFRMGPQDSLAFESFEKRVHPDDLNQVKQAIQAAITNYAEYQMEYRLVDTAGGRTRSVFAQGRVEADEYGRPSRLFGTVQDITERKFIQNRLRESEERYSHILSSVSEGIYGVDEYGRAMFLNPAAEQMLGYRSEHLTGKVNHELFHHSKSDGTPYLMEENPIMLTLSDGAARHLENEVFWRKDGTSFLVNYKVNPIMDNGRILGAVVVFHDISNEIEIVRAKEHAERADHAKSEFLAMMSHEIRTPMNGIIGMTGLLQDTELTEEQREYTEIIASSGEALLRIINDILDFSKVEAGKMALEEEPFNLRETLSSSVELFYPKLEEKGLKVEINIDPSVPAIVIGDATRFRQVLMNLIGNAVKFTDEGSITVSVHADEMDGRAQSRIIYVTVEDTGIGIPEGKLDELFQSFSQLHPSINRKYGGTGLGLAISRRLVHLMGGDISVESAEMVGSVFRFHIVCSIFPDGETAALYEASEESEQDPDEIKPLSFVPPKVLIAEDNIVGSKLLHRLLWRLGSEADAAENGIEAVEAMLRTSYDIVFMDIQMPIMDGVKATTLVRQLLPEGKLPYIVALTAYARSEDKIRCLEAGMQGFISKPVQLADIRRVFETWHAKKSVTNP